VPAVDHVLHAILVPLLAVVLVAGVVALVILAIRRRPRHRPIA
jgi:Flp pilus assembly protein protease CpaA